MFKRPRPEDTVLVLIDIQERLVQALPENATDKFIPRVKLLLHAAKLLNIRTIITEQYPKGLGHTLPQLINAAPGNTPVIEKNSFSCYGNPVFRSEINKLPLKNIVLTGMETHVCIQQTNQDATALNNGQVIIVPNAITARHQSEHLLALDQMAHGGARLVSAEALTFMWLETAAHPAFKELSRIIKEL